MSDSEVQKYLKNTELSDIQQEQVLSSDNRNNMYSKIIQLRYIIRAAKLIFDARSTLRKQGIFIPKELESALEDTLKKWSDVQIEREMEFNYGRDSETRKKTAAFLTDGQGEFDNIKQEVRSRILSTEAAKSY